MKTFEIYFDDLNPEAQVKYMKFLNIYDAIKRKSFGQDTISTIAEAENLNLAPLAMVDVEVE